MKPPEDLLKILQTDFHDYLGAQLLDQEPNTLYDPVRYIMSSKGKRFRALIALLGYLGYDEDYSNAMPLAYAVELFHNFTLVHDDIMDDAPLRRGKPSVHEHYDTNSAILSGDVMHSTVFKILSDIDSPMCVHMISRFAEVSIEVCEGQSYDMQFEEREIVGIEEYLEMIEAKTAVLLGLSLELGALAGGASASNAHHLFQFGKYAGICFQLQDDYLDLYGESHSIGKQKGGDIIQRKKNYFYVKALDLLEGADRDRFIKIYSADTPDEQRVLSVMKIYNELYIKNYLEEAKDAYLSLSISHLDQSEYDDKIKPALLDLIQSFANRNH